MAVVLLILSIAPVIFFGYQIYVRDFDKEPTQNLIKLFFCGVGATFLTLFITGVLSSIIPFFDYDSDSLSLIELIPYVFIGVALVEEFSKWIFVYKLEYNNQEYNHLYDGIVFAGFVALGFACLENILYVLQSGVQTAIVRAFLAIPGHLCDGIMMGYYLSLAKLSLINKDVSLSKKNIVLSLLVPTITHGIYDYLLFAGEKTDNYLFMGLFVIFIAVFFSNASKKVKQLASNSYNLNPSYVSPKKAVNNMYYQVNQSNYVNKPMNNVNNQKYCTNCGAKVVGQYCSQCGHKTL